MKALLAMTLAVVTSIGVFMLVVFVGCFLVGLITGEFK